MVKQSLGLSSVWWRERGLSWSGSCLFLSLFVFFKEAFLLLYFLKWIC